MTQDEIIRMAREAGFSDPAPSDGFMGVAFYSRGYMDSGGSLERFFNLAFATAAAHEACAKVCDERGFDPYTEQQCAAAIRGLK